MTELRRPTIGQQREFWNWHWRHGEERRTVNPWKDQRHVAIRAMLMSLGLEEPRILDVGCGTGFYTRSLAELGPTTAIDLSSEAIAQASKRFPAVTFHAGNYYEYPLPEGGFDVIVAQEVIEHVEDQKKFVERTARLLKPGGHFAFSCTNKYVMDRLPEDAFPEQRDEHIADFLDMKGIRTLLAPEFAVRRWTSIIPLGNRGLLRLVNSRRLNGLLGVVVPQERLDALKGRLGLCYQFIVLAGKR